jgi:prolyl oligopeptidase
MKRILIYTALSTMALAMNAQTSQLKYPKAPKSATVDNYFGIKVKDTYRPLENDTASATLKWVEQENAITFDYLKKIPYREALRSRLSELNDYKKVGLPWKWKDGNYYYYENDGLKNQSVLYRVKNLGDTPEVFLDPNALSTDGTVALTGISMSPDGKYLAYSISRSGSDWTEIYVMDVATKQLLSDHIEWAKFTGMDWHGNGFYYSAYARPEAGKEYSNANEYHKVYFHTLGTSQDDDKIIFEDKNAPLHFHSASISEDETVLFVYAGGQGIGQALYMKDLRRPDSQWVTIEPTQDNSITVCDVIDGTMYIYTSIGAPNYRLMTASVDAPQRENWKELIPESNSVFTGVKFAGDSLLLTYDKDAANHVYVYTMDGKMVRELQLPSYGSVGISAYREHPNDVFYSFTSFLSPSSIYKYDMATGESTLYKSSQLKGFNSEDYVTEQVFYPSTDGTMIPMFMTYKKGLKKDGTNPVYIYGYGGFNITLNPNFSPNRLLWLENGGIYCQTNLRGGAEYGDKWHMDGTKLNKLNVFNDFISAAEYMQREGWTTKDLTTIEGGSNGGLLIGACVNMRPDLFRVAIPRVGVMDMMRYHLFTVGWNWAPDYGTSADSKEMAQYLLNYSPIHNIKNDGTRYPSILITTADHDDRVVPAHSFKYAATLQAAKTGNNPKLIRIDTKAGHGAGKPIGKIIDEYADLYSFIFYNLGIEPKTAK